MKAYDDKYLASLQQVFLGNPDDLAFKKFFALELYKRKEYQNAYPLLIELYKEDKDINIEKALNDIKSKIPQDKVIGFDVDYSQDPDISKLDPHKHKRSDTITFADIAGMDEIKEAIRTDIIYPFQHPEVYKQYNKKSGGGILLFGPPGCGKTYITKATAGEIDAKFYNVSIHELISSFAGEGERALHSSFEMARDNTPSVLFFDEIDAIGMSRGKTSGVLRTLVNQFLTEMDGVQTDNNGVIIIGATNLPWEVDSALRRPGRFDKVLFVSPPDKVARAKMFEINMKDKPHEKLDHEKLAELTKQYSSADIARICDEASESAFKEAIRTNSVVKINQELMEEKAKIIRSSIVDWFSTVKNYIQYSNESGLFNSVKDYMDRANHD